jgi:hypothetical protein
METMPTIVQSFMVNETKELVLDGEKLSEWNELVAELGLFGQVETTNGDKSPIPFVFIKQNLKNVMEQLCPRKVEVTDFKISPIPLDILKLVKLAKDEKYFSSIEVWYDDKSPDPFVVGNVGHWYETDWYADSNKELKGLKFGSKEEVKNAGGNRPNFCTQAQYLIAKWGDVAMSFEEMSEKAKQRYLETRGAELTKKIKESQNELSVLKEEAIERFAL